MNKIVAKGIDGTAVLEGSVLCLQPVMMRYNASAYVRVDDIIAIEHTAKGFLTQGQVTFRVAGPVSNPDLYTIRYGHKQKDQWAAFLAALEEARNNA